VAVKILNPSHCFAGMLPNEIFLVEKAINRAMSQPRLFEAGNSSWNSYLWFLGRNRFERNILVHWRFVSYPKHAFEFFLPSMEEPIKVPIEEFREVWWEKKLQAFVHFAEPFLREVENYSSRHYLFIQLLRPAGEEFASILAWAFRVGYPDVIDVIGIPPPYITKPDVEFALKLVQEMRLYSARQGNWRPAYDYLENISAEFATWIAWIRRWLLYLYGIVPDKHLWCTSETSKAPLNLVIPPEMVTEEIRLINGARYTTPREVLIQWTKEVMYNA